MFYFFAREREQGGGRSRHAGIIVRRANRSGCFIVILHMVSSTQNRFLIVVPQPRPALALTLTIESNGKLENRQQGQFIYNLGMPPNAYAAIDAVYRSDWGRIVATLIKVTGDFDVAEESAQEAFAAAAGPRRAVFPARLDPANGAAQSHRPHPPPRQTRGKAQGDCDFRGRLGRCRAELRHDGNPRRASAADLHVLPSGAGARVASSPDA